MWFHCVVTGGPVNHRIRSSRLVRRVVRGFNPERGRGWQGVGLVADRSGTYLVQPHGQLGSRALWLDIPQPHGFLAHCRSGKLTPIANISTIRSNIPVPVPDTAIDIPQPGCYTTTIPALRICDALPITPTMAVALLEPPVPVDVYRLNSLMDRLKQAMLLPAGLYWSDGENQFLQFTLGETTAQLAVGPGSRPCVELCRSDWNLLELSLPNTMSGDDMPDLVALSVTDYDKIRNRRLITDSIDPVVVGTHMRWKPILERALHSYDLTLDLSTTDWPAQLKDRLSIHTAYLQLHDIHWHLMNRYSFKFAVVAAEVSYQANRYIAIPLKVAASSLYGLVLSIVDSVR